MKVVQLLPTCLIIKAVTHLFADHGRLLQRCLLIWNVVLDYMLFALFLTFSKQWLTEIALKRFFFFFFARMYHWNSDLRATLIWKSKSDLYLWTCNTCKWIGGWVEKKKTAKFFMWTLLGESISASLECDFHKCLV